MTTHDTLSRQLLPHVPLVPVTYFVTDVGIWPKYMTGADWHMGQELAGSGLVLTGTGTVSALGWSATWVWVNHVV
jgi:hypothetical protein